MHQVSTDKPRVVHSSYGRLRVHLPDPDGHIAVQLLGQPGVSFAQGSRLTDNLLILFDPYTPLTTNEYRWIAEERIAYACPRPAALNIVTGLPTA